MKVLKFDRSATPWCRDNEMIKFFIIHQIEYIRQRLRANGYIYLSDIYETFGVAWDPHDENTVWIHNEHDFQLRYARVGDDAFEIYIA